MQHPDVFAPAQLGPVRLRNRVVKAATFEGMTPDALVTDALVDYHLAVARGGVGMTTVAYFAVAPEGRTDRHQIHLRESALPGLQQIRGGFFGMLGRLEVPCQHQCKLSRQLAVARFQATADLMVQMHALDPVEAVIEILLEEKVPEAVA